MTGLAYRAGVLVAIATSLLSVWTTIVRDDDTGIGYFMVIMAAAVGGFSASFRSQGMARAMLGVAVMQLSLGSLIATAPVTANMPGGLFKVLLFNVLFALLWLISSALFYASSRDRRPRDAHGS